jgi:hypothetical protein
LKGTVAVSFGPGKNTMNPPGEEIQMIKC